MICIIAFFVFGVLGIFSAKYRSYAKESWRCIFRMATFRRCDTKLDQRIKSKITAKLMRRSPKSAKFVFNHFEALSWIFTIAFFASLGYSAYSVYNLAVYGSCSPYATCIFAPQATAQQNICTITAEFVFFYGEGCPHCAKMLPIIEQVEKETGIEFEKLETFHNKTNMNAMLLHAKDIERDCSFLGVPTFLSMKTNKSLCGEKTKEEIKRFIIENG